MNRTKEIKEFLLLKGFDEYQLILNDEDEEIHFFKNTTTKERLNIIIEEV